MLTLLFIFVKEQGNSQADVFATKHKIGFNFKHFTREILCKDRTKTA
jgi:hypothetical protein